MEKPKPFVSEKKKKEVQVIKDLIKKHKVVGLADITGFPSPQLQSIRLYLKEKLHIRITKARLINIAIDGLKDIKGLDKLKENLTGMPALLFSNEEPFKLAKALAKSKSPAPAKIGQIVPKDIVIPAGPTNFTPGPIIGELGAAGLKTGVEAGKIVIKEDKVVAKKGEEVTQKIFDLFGKFKIEPMEVGLKITALLEDGMVYPGEVLSVDEKEYLNNLISSYYGAFSLALEIGYITKETVEHLIKKAEIAAKSLESKIPEKLEEKVEEKKEEAKEIPKEEVKQELKQEKIEKKKEEKPAEGLVDEILKKAEKEGLRPEKEKTKSSIGPSQEDIKKAEEVVKQIMGGAKPEDFGKGVLQLKGEREEKKKKKEKEDKDFKEAEKAAQDILKKI